MSRWATGKEIHDAWNSTEHKDPTRFLLEKGVIDSDEFAFLKAPILTEAQRERERQINERVSAWRLAEHQHLMGEKPAPARPARKPDPFSGYNFKD